MSKDDFAFEFLTDPLALVDPAHMIRDLQELRLLMPSSDLTADQLLEIWRSCGPSNS